MHIGNLTLLLLTALPFIVGFRATATLFWSAATLLGLWCTALGLCCGGFVCILHITGFGRLLYGEFVDFRYNFLGFFFGARLLFLIVVCLVSRFAFAAILKTRIELELIIVWSELHIFWCKEWYDKSCEINGSQLKWSEISRSLPNKTEYLVVLPSEKASKIRIEAG